MGRLEFPLILSEFFVVSNHYFESPKLTQRTLTRASRLRLKNLTVVALMERRDDDFVFGFRVPEEFSAHDL